MEPSGENCLTRITSNACRLLRQGRSVEGAATLAVEDLSERRVRNAVKDYDTPESLAKIPFAALREWLYEEVKARLKAEGLTDDNGSHLERTVPWIG